MKTNGFAGRCHTEESRMKMSETRTGKPHPHKGWHPSEETLIKLKEANTGRKHSEESIQKMRKAKIGKHPSEETRKKMCASQAGHLCTEETKQKLRESNVGKIRPDFVHHHVKYKEIHGEDVVVILTISEHIKLHQRLRREGKCNIAPEELRIISDKASRRRGTVK